MSCKSLLSVLAVGAVLAVSPQASAVIVVQDDTIVDGGNNLNATEFIDFGGAFITTGTDLSDGNSFGIIHQIGEFSAAGLSHHIPIADITSVQPLVDGITLRASAWFVSDPVNPWNALSHDGFTFEFYNTALGEVNTADMNNDTAVGMGLGLSQVAQWPSTTAWTQQSFTVPLTDAQAFFGTLEEVRLGLFEGDFSGRSPGAGGGRLFVDGLVVEVFPDLATANATALPSNQPGGFNPIPEPATLSLMGLGGAMMLRRRSV